MSVRNPEILRYSEFAALRNERPEDGILQIVLDGPDLMR